MATEYAIPEHWTALDAAREGRRQCLADVDLLKHKCKDNCEAVHIADCPQCCSAILDRIRDRYRSPESSEWFSQRSAFLMTLEGMFAEAQGSKMDLSAMEQAIESEKEAWYRLVLRRHPDFLEVAGVDQDAVRNILDDPDRSREELVSTVWEAVGQPDDWSSRVDAFSEKTITAAQDPEALKKLYISQFFKDDQGNTLEHGQKYLDMYESNPNVRLEEIVDRIIAAKKDGTSLQAQRDNHKRRLDELRRAKTAYEQNKIRLKGQLRDAQTQQVSERLYHLPSCSVCQKEVDPEEVVSCSLCQALCQMGGAQEMTLYCSRECLDKGEEEHLEEKHCCCAEGSCVRNQDADDEMEGMSEAVACNSCFGQKEAALFCSLRCAYENLATHRQEKHDAKTIPEEVRELVTAVDKVIEETLQMENLGLEYTWI